MDELKEMIGKHYLVKMPNDNELVEVEYAVLTDIGNLMVVYHSGPDEGVAHWCEAGRLPVVVEVLVGLHGMDPAVPQPAFGMQIIGQASPELPPVVYGDVQGPVQL